MALRLELSQCHRIKFALRVEKIGDGRLIHWQAGCTTFNLREILRMRILGHLPVRHFLLLWRLHVQGTHATEGCIVVQLVVVDGVLCPFFRARALLAAVEAIRALILMHHHPREAVLRVLGTELLWGLCRNILMSLGLDDAFIA